MLEFTVEAMEWIAKGILLIIVFAISSGLWAFAIHEWMKIIK